MNYEIIYTDDYALIVSDEKIEKYDYVFNPIYKTLYQWIENADIHFDRIDAKKVIAHRPLTDAPILEGVPLLPEFSQEDDVEKLAKLAMSELTESRRMMRVWIAGYNKAKETYIEILKSIESLCDNQNPTHEAIWRLCHSVQQPKRPKSIVLETVGDTETINRCKNFDIEIGCVASRCTCENLFIPKTLTNSQGRTELVGTYYYG